MAQVGSASALGAEGRRFKSGYPDTTSQQQAPADVAGACFAFAGGSASQPLPPARKATQPSLIRSAWPSVNMSMHESCV